MVRDVSDNITHDSPADVVGILDALTGLARQLPGPTCGVTTAIEKIAAAAPEVAEQVRVRVNSAEYPASGVATVLENRTGVKVSAFTVRRHRKRGTPDGCRCPR
jgi:hypothetical protein